MSLNSRISSIFIDQGDFVDISMTFFAMASVIFSLACMYIVVNPYFDWKAQGDDTAYINVGIIDKGIKPTDQGTSRSVSTDT